MPVSTYFNVGKNKIKSRYHQVTKRLGTTYGSIHKTVTSKFHHEDNDILLVRYKLNNIFQKSSVPLSSKSTSQEAIPIISKSIFTTIALHYKKNINWSRGRFSGETIKKDGN